MTDEQCIVAVDVGNTAVKVALIVDSKLTMHEVRIGTSGWELSMIGWLRDQLGSDPARADTMHCRIASVHRSAATQLETAFRGRFSGASIQIVTRRNVPIRLDVDYPDRVGIDRVLSAFAAYRRFGGPVAVIDAGSAVTVDWVDRKGSFCGGAILPGLQLQARSLVMGTEALPQIDLSDPCQIVLPAKNTTDAIQAGIVIGVAGAIEGLVDRYRQAHSVEVDQYQVVLTGGDSPTLSPCLTLAHKVVANLVCHGLLELSETT